MQEKSDIRNKVFSNFIWRFAERSGAQLVSFVVSIILARILSPETYGTIELVLVFTNILQVFVDSGLGNALIQKKDADELDFSTVFYTNIVFCVLLYVLVYIGAPIVANFYSDYTLVPVIRILSLSLVISGVRNVQQAYISRNMLFRKFFFSTITGTIVAAIVGILLAIRGYGVWALVAQQLLNALVGTMVLWLTVKWRPRLVFCFHRLKSLFSFGWKLLASSLLDTIYHNLRQLVIGKFYSPADLAYYNRGNKIPHIIVVNINTSIDSVLLPAMSKEQDNKQTIKNMTRRAIKTSTYIMAPLLLGLAFTSKNVVLLLLTEKWLTCVPYMIIFCVTYMFWPIHTANLNAIKAMGRSDIFLKLEIIKKSVDLVLTFSTMWFGVKVMAYSLLISSLLSQIINSWPNKKLLNYSYVEQMKDIAMNIFMALVMGVCVSFVPVIAHSILLTLIVQIVLGAIIYIGISMLTKNETFFYILKIVSGVMKRN